MAFRRSRVLGPVNKPEFLNQALVGFWATINESTATLLDSYNVASITNNGTGDFTVTFVGSFSATQYALFGMAQSGAAQNAYPLFKQDVLPAVGSITFKVLNISTAGFESVPRVGIGGIGLGGPVAPSQDNQALAWVRFNISSTAPVIGQSYNVASLTDSGAGDTTVNFASALGNANYCVAGLCGNTTDGSGVGYNMNIKPATTPSTTSVEVITSLGNQQLGTDVSIASVIILGHL